MMGLKIDSIRVKGFRGFNDEVFIPFSQKLTVIYGLNGSGKSSLSEAIEWLFFDEISRKRLSPCPGEYSSSVYLRNLYYQDSQNPFVEAVVSFEGKKFSIRKELLSEKEYKLTVDGVKIENIKEQFPDFNKQSRPILAQVEISALVNTEQKDRWEQLAKILGQEELTTLRENLINLRAIKRDAAYKRDEETYKGLCRGNEDFLLEKAFIESFENLDRENFEKIVRTLLIEKGVKESSIEKGLQTVIASITGLKVGKELAELESIEESLINERFEKIEKLVGSLEKNAEEASSGSLTHDQVHFFDKGLTLSKVPQCPFCLENTLTGNRLEEIQKVIVNDKASIDAQRRFDEYINALERGSKNNYELGTLIPQSNQLKILAQKLSDIGLDKDANAIRKFDEESNIELEKVSSKLSVVFNGYVDLLNQYYFEKKDVNLESAKNALINHITDSKNTIELINSKWAQCREDILSHLPEENSDQEAELRKWVHIEKVWLFIKARVRFTREYYLIETVAKSAQKKLEEFEKREVAALLAKHSEEIKRYYELLNPGETVTFKEIKVTTGTRRQAKLIANGPNDKELNPVTIFSEAHINSLSISIYFPQRVDMNPMWDSIILDDPVQSMDKNHSKNLIEILAEKSKSKQVIVLSHSFEFTQEVINRLNTNDISYYEFVDSEQNSPLITLKKGPTLDYLAFVSINLNGDSVAREGAANSLRKAIESLICEILMLNGRTLAQVSKWTNQGITVLFDQLERIQKIEGDDIGKLKVLIDEGHAGSHAFSLKDPSPGGLRLGVKNISEVYKKYCK